MNRYIRRKHQREYGHQTLNKPVKQSVKQPAASHVRAPAQPVARPNRQQAPKPKPIAQSVVIDEYKMQVAALVIQLAWRRFSRRVQQQKDEILQRQREAELLASISLK